MTKLQAEMDKVEPKRLTQPPIVICYVLSVPTSISLRAGTVETRRAFAAQVLRGFDHNNHMDQATAQPTEAAKPE